MGKDSEKGKRVNEKQLRDGEGKRDSENDNMEMGNVDRNRKRENGKLLKAGKKGKRKMGKYKVVSKRMEKEKRKSGKENMEIDNCGEKGKRESRKDKTEMYNVDEKGKEKVEIGKYGNWKKGIILVNILLQVGLEPIFSA